MMKNPSVEPETQRIEVPGASGKSEQAKKPAWETPKLEDVSEQVMAQPYIRFT
jgi:hypothetical protein